MPTPIVLIGAMPRFSNSIRWCTDLLMKEDWISRHDHLWVLWRNNPTFYHGVVAMMSPSDCLWGENGGRRLLATTIVVCRNASDRKRQKRITEYFQPIKRQTLAIEY